MYHEKPEFESQQDPVLNTVIVLKCVEKKRNAEIDQKDCSEVINNGVCPHLVNIL